MTLPLIPPRVAPPLDEEFRPAVLARRAFQNSVESESERLVIGLERNNGEFSRIELKVFPESHSTFGANLEYVDRALKFLLWQRGGHQIYVGGSRKIGEHIRNDYAANGARNFDYHFM